MSTNNKYRNFEQILRSQGVQNYFSIHKKILLKYLQIILL